MKKFAEILKNGSIMLLLVLAATVLGSCFSRWDFHESNIVIVYLLSVLLTARFTKGYAYGIGATLLSFVLYNWFFTEPYYSLKIKDPTYIITVIIMTVTATITSALTSKVKAAAAEAKEKEAESNALYRMTNCLTDAENAEKIALITVETVNRMLFCQSAFICCDETGTPYPHYLQLKEDGTPLRRELESSFSVPPREAGGSPFPAASGEFCDFAVYGRTMLLAVLRIPAETAFHLSKEHTRLLHAVLESISLALDRLRIWQEQTRSKEEITQERYRGNLLRAISHDLRTPLSGIMGTSEMLMGMTEKEDPRYGLSKDIYEDADWLHGLVENILNLTKFQDGHMSLKKVPEAAEEVVGAALLVMEKRTADRTIKVSVPDTLLMVPMEARLIQQVLVNLLDNAVKHTPADREIAVTVTEDVEAGAARFAVLDRGSGIPPEALPHLFQMFFTVGSREASSKKGIGLGLSICQSIIEAHGGSITAENREGGGAVFTFTLPLKEE